MTSRDSTRSILQLELAIMGLSRCLFLLLILFFKRCNTSTSSHQQPSSCHDHDEECSALLEFKQSFTITENASGLSGAYPKVSSWNPAQGGNRSCCCTWDGVECDEETGHVVKLNLTSSWLYGSINSNSSLFKLVHLERLSLADNHFNYSQIPTTIKNLPMLTHLDLSNSVFSGQVPSQISQLVKLTSLNLFSPSINDPSVGLLKLDGSSFRNLIQNLTSLELLRLRLVNISSTIPESMANLSFMKNLYLQQCELFGDFPVRFFQLQNLKNIYLRDNLNLIGYLPKFNRSNSIRTLDIHGTRFFGNLASSIENLNSLEQLDVGACNFSQGLVPSSLGNLRQLTYLDISATKVVGLIPDSFVNLTNLRVLRISTSALTGPIPSWVGNFSKLIYLDFGYTGLNSSVPASFSNLTNLEILYLQNNQLRGVVEFQMFQKMPYLYQLQLGPNNLEFVSKSTDMNASTIQQFTILNLNSCKLRYFPYFLQYQKSLERLEVSGNELHGHVPKWMYNMSTETLTFFNLGNNYLSGFDQLPVLLPWVALKYFNLAFNMFNGPLPIPAAPNLLAYQAQDNNFTGEVSPLICNSSSLLALDLSDNNMRGMIPQCFENLTSLQALDLSNNNFTGKIQHLLGSDHLVLLLLRNNSFHGSLPETYTNRSSLKMLDVSQNQLRGQVPKWMYNMSTETLTFFNLENNYLSGFIQLPVLLPWVALKFFSLAFNMFNGPLPVPAAPNLLAYQAQDNNFIGEVSPLICNSSSILALDLSANKLSGMIPQCFENLTSLQALDLSNNNLSGQIPRLLSSDQLVLLLLRNNSFQGTLPETYTNRSNLKMLDVSKNQLQGQVPRSLANCLMLETLILSNNNFSDVFPFWLGSLPELKLLAMRHNGFLGVIEKHENKDVWFPKLRVLDLSHNDFTGEFRAEYIFNKYAMRPNITVNLGTYMQVVIVIYAKPFTKGDTQISYGSEITITNRGVDRYYSKIQEAFAVIDISSNKFEGKVDDWIGNLIGLRLLNVSNNLLTGRIPSSFGNLMQLESMDLSNNKLSGEIPPNLAQLTFLAEFNVSHNNLSGPIPSGTQLIGFNVTSYEGNPGLCGDPLPKKCGSSNAPGQPPPSSIEEKDSGDGIDLDWKFVMAGLGSGLVVGVVLADMAITRRPDLFLEMVGIVIKFIERITSLKGSGH